MKKLLFGNVHFALFCPAGSVPATDFLKQSSIHMDSKGFVTVNKVFWKVFNKTINANEKVLSYLVNLLF